MHNKFEKFKSANLKVNLNTIVGGEDPGVPTEGCEATSHHWLSVILGGPSTKQDRYVDFISTC